MLWAPKKARKASGGVVAVIGADAVASFPTLAGVEVTAITDETPPRDLEPSGGDP